ncbi:MAG: hypothetical protein IE933_07730 [Sphingomonadales bacterium]|nr:hypothetical protein [Sphingomonadales bacterium]MBD3773803.1 hypothetical protein [Paracoccaceae bacterium]
MKLKQLVLAATAATAIFAATPAWAVNEYKQFEHWTVFKNPDNCRMIGTFENDSAIAASYSPGDDTTLLMVTAPKIPAKDEDVTYKLYFLTGKQLDDSWGEITAQNFSMDGSGAMRAAFTGDALLKDIGSSDYIALYRGDELVISLRLQEVPPALASLRECLGKL